MINKKRKIWGHVQSGGKATEPLLAEVVGGPQVHGTDWLRV